MKKLLLSSLLMVACATLSFGQASLSNNPASGSVRFRSNGAENSGFGVKGGVNLCDVRGKGIDAMYKDQKWLTQYHFGAYAQVGINNWFSIQPEILYQRKGFKGAQRLSIPDLGIDTVGAERTVKLSYLSAPILFVFNVFDNVGIQVGPSFSYLLNVRNGGSEAVDATKYNFNSFDMGLVGGFEAKIEFLRIGARYDYSLTDLRKEGNVEINGILLEQTKKDIKSGVFQIYLGVGI